jgi:outer membrane biosynthesis protein TonB
MHRPANLSLPTLISEAKSAISALELEVSTRLGMRPPPIGNAEHEATRKPTPPSGLRLTQRRTGNEQPPILPLSTDQLVDQSHQTVTIVPLVEPSLTIDAPAPRETLAAEGEESRAIYSSSDADVLPPVLRFPQALSPPPLVDRRSEALNSMELVISPSGTVEHVRLVAGPTRMTDMMLLSGAKMWRFEPAFKNGAPVRYRMIVSWIGGP